MTNLQIPRWRNSLVILLSVWSMAPLFANDGSAEDVLQVTPQNVPARPQAEGRISRKAQKNASNEASTAELLAMIPENHPMREELRQVVLKGPPDGFTARQWLELAMKFNFRSVGSKHASTRVNSY